MPHLLSKNLSEWQCSLLFWKLLKASSSLLRERQREILSSSDFGRASFALLLLLQSPERWGGCTTAKSRQPTQGQTVCHQAEVFLLDSNFSILYDSYDIEYIWFLIKSFIYQAMSLYVPKVLVKRHQNLKWFDSDICHHLKCVRTLKRNHRSICS